MIIQNIFQLGKIYKKYNSSQIYMAKIFCPEKCSMLIFFNTAIDASNLNFSCFKTSLG